MQIYLPLVAAQRALNFRKVFPLVRPEKAGVTTSYFGDFIRILSCHIG